MQPVDTENKIFLFYCADPIHHTLGSAHECVFSTHESSATIYISAHTRISALKVYLWKCLGRNYFKSRIVATTLDSLNFLQI